MDLRRILETLGSSRPAGIAIAAWSICATERRSLGLGTKDGQTGNAHAPLNLAEGLGASYLLVWKDGLVSRGRWEKRQIEQDAREAVVEARRAAYVDPDAAQVLGPADFPDVVLHDSAVARLACGDTDVLEKRHELVRGKVARGSVRTWSASFGAAEAETRLVTSAGLAESSRGTAASWHVSLDGEWGDGHSAREMESPLEFEARIDRLIGTVRLLAEPATPMQGGVHPVILHPHVVEGFVLGTVLHHLDGATVAHGEGQFARDDFEKGRVVLREDLSLRLDPLRSLRGGAYRFTAEGVPADRCSYIVGGRLVTPILGLKYSRRLGLEPTPVPYGMDTLDLVAGETIEVDDAWERAAGGVLVLGVLGVHTQDSTSGDFSLSAPQTLRIGPKGPAGRLRATVSGNVFDLLRSDDLRLVRFKGEHTPGLLIQTRLDPT